MVWCCSDSGALCSAGLPCCCRLTWTAGVNRATPQSSMAVFPADSSCHCFAGQAAGQMHHILTVATQLARSSWPSRSSLQQRHLLWPPQCLNFAITGSRWGLNSLLPVLYTAVRLSRLTLCPLSCRSVCNAALSTDRGALIPLFRLWLPTVLSSWIHQPHAHQCT